MQKYCQDNKDNDTNTMEFSLLDLIDQSIMESGKVDKKLSHFKIMSVVLPDGSIRGLPFNYQWGGGAGDKLFISRRVARNDLFKKNYASPPGDWMVAPLYEFTAPNGIHSHSLRQTRDIAVDVATYT